MAYPNPADLEAMRKDPDVKLLEQEGLNVGYLAFNTEKKPFDDKRVRQALNMAINKQAIIDAVFQGSGTVGEEPDPADDLVLQRRRQGLPLRSRGGQEAARRGRLRERLRDQPLGDAGAAALQPERQAHGRADPGRLAKVGVKAEIVTYEWGEYLQALARRASTRPCCSAGPATMAIPTTSCYVLLGCEAAKDGNNRARWCYKPFDDLIMKAKQITESPSAPSSTSRRR